MKIVIDCDEQHIDQAWAIVSKEAAAIGRYDRVGWGWGFGSEPRFFVRRLMTGLSIMQVRAVKRTPANRIAP